MKMPLQKTRILDLTQMIAGSYGSMILADLGAEVIKIEPPSGDPMRDGAGHRIHGQRISFLSFNRNKKSVVLDLSREESRKVFYALEVFKTKTTEEWEKILTDKDVPCGPVNTLDKALNNPQVLAQEMVIKATNQEGYSVQLMGNPIKMATMPSNKYDYPPKLGEHTEQVLSELLGYSQKQLIDLRSIKVIN